MGLVRVIEVVLFVVLGVNVIICPWVLLYYLEQIGNQLKDIKDLLKEDHKNE